ncbi:MAG: outer membrane protein assembly factor BamD [Ignavibacteria bacterium]|nr:outer membrane protein assembly factor BamD [Ignavibacteria bacterium]
MKKIYLCFLFILIFIACSTTKKEVINSADDLFNIAKAEFQKKKFEEAEKYFDLLKLQYPGSQYADDAQFYLGEISFEKGDYIMAAFHYSTLRRWFPSSEYCKVALFKTGLSYYQLSPPYDREQEYTFKAIEYFLEFRSTYPDDSLNVATNLYLKELRNKLAYRNLFTANLYYKWQSYKSALIYLDIVLDEYPDTDYVEDAFWLKILIYKERGLFYDLEELIKQYKRLFPNGKYFTQVENIENLKGSK